MMFRNGDFLIISTLIEDIAYNFIKASGLSL